MVEPTAPTADEGVVVVVVVKDAGAAAAVEVGAGVTAVNELEAVVAAVVAAFGAPNMPVDAGVVSAVEEVVAGVVVAAAGAPNVIGEAEAVGLVPSENAKTQQKSKLKLGEQNYCKNYEDFCITVGIQLQWESE